MLKYRGRLSILLGWFSQQFYECEFDFDFEIYQIPSQIRGAGT